MLALCFRLCRFCVSDYVGFIKKVMKQLQHPRYQQVKKVDIDLQQLDVSDTPHPGSGECICVQYGRLYVQEVMGV